MPRQLCSRIMSKCAFLASIALIFLVGSTSVIQVAQADNEDYDYHPLLTDKFTLSLGAYRSRAAYKVSASSDAEFLAESGIEFDETLGVDDQTTLFHGVFRWRFSEKWSLAGQYFRTNTTGEATLMEDLDWQNLLFKQGSFAAGGIKTSVARLFLGRVFNRSPQHEFGAGIGLHNLKIAAFIEGEALLNDGTSGFRTGKASNSAPLPNAGVWYWYSPARRWLITSRVDFMTANIGDYDGTLWNGNIGVNYQAGRHVGIGFAYQYFSLNVKVDKSDWQGKVNLKYHGPVVSVTANW